MPSYIKKQRESLYYFLLYRSKKNCYIFPLGGNKMHSWNIFYFMEVTVCPLDFPSFWQKYSLLWHRSLQMEMAKDDAFIATKWKL